MRRIVTGLMLLVCFTINGQQLDTANSRVTFTITKMISHSVHGTIGGFQGELHFEDSVLAGIAICIKPKTVNTDHAYRDKKLLEEDYFDVENHPLICFHSDSILNSETGLTAVGVLSMLGVERPETFTLTKSDYGYTGKAVINRNDYHLGGEALFKIGEEVTLKVHCAVLY